MTARTKHLILALAGTVLIAAWALSAAAPASRVGVSTSRVAEQGGSVAAGIDEGPDPSETAANPVSTELVAYAIALNELQGFSPDATPGTTFDLWVAWEPPITKRPRIDLLVGDVTLEAVVPPLLPDGPMVAKLLVPKQKISDLLYGDRYGALSLVAPSISTANRD